MWFRTCAAGTCASNVCRLGTSASPLNIQPGRDDAHFSETMVKDDQAVVETNVAVGQFQIVDGAARKFRLGEILQVVAPVTERAAERKRQVNFVEQFKARHQSVEQMPWIAELNVMRDA